TGRRRRRKRKPRSAPIACPRFRSKRPGARTVPPIWWRRRRRARFWIRALPPPPNTAITKHRATLAGSPGVSLDGPEGKVPRLRRLMVFPGSKAHPRRKSAVAFLHQFDGHVFGLQKLLRPVPSAFPGDAALLESAEARLGDGGQAIIDANNPVLQLFHHPHRPG